MSMAERTASGTFSWAFFNRFTKGKNQPAPVAAPPSDHRPDLKRRWETGAETEEESPQTKRIRRSSPPRVSSRMQTEPVSVVRRSASVKALNPNDVHNSDVQKKFFSSLRSEASFASGRSGFSRGPSAGLESQMGRIKLQTPSSPTPGADWSSLARTAGVSQKAYNVNSSLAPTERLSFQNNSLFSNGAAGERRSVLRQETPSGATFGPAKQTFDRAMSLASRKSPTESPPKISKPTLNRHSDSAPWAGKSGSTRQRLGDGSLSRNRTISLMSYASNTSEASAPSAISLHDRTTPTPNDRDEAWTSPPSATATSPTSSATHSPSPTTRRELPSNVPRHIQQAYSQAQNFTTTLKHSRSFSQSGLKVNVPMPSKKSSAASFGRSSDASSRLRSPSVTDSEARSPNSKAPYMSGREKTLGKKILERRKAEEKEMELIDSNRQDDMEDLHVEPIKKGKENADPAVKREADEKHVSKYLKPRTAPTSSESNSGTSSRTVGRSQLRVPREKHPQTAAVAHQSPVKVEKGFTRIPQSEVPARFKPEYNERLQRATSTGRYSVPPDEDDEPSPISRKPPEKMTPTSPKIERSDEDATQAMNISPIKEVPESDNSSDMMSTTPTESSFKNAFKSAPIIRAPSTEGSVFSSVSPVPSPTTTASAEKPPTFSGFTPTITTGATSTTGGTAPFSFGFPAPKVTSQEPQAIIKKEESPASIKSAPAPAPGFSFNNTSAPAQPIAAPSLGFTPSISSPALGQFTLPSSQATTAPAKVPTPPDKPAGPGPLFSFGTVPSTSAAPSITVTEPPKITPFSFGALPTSTPTVEAPKPPTIGSTSNEAPKPFSFGPPPKSMAPKEANAATDGSNKPVIPPFSFGAPPPTTPAPSMMTTSDLPSTTPATPSPTKPPFSFTTPVAASLNLSTTPQSSPFSFGSESPSPVKPAHLGEPVDVTTPTKPPFSFGAPTTPSTTPAPNAFSFGNTPAPSTTPAATPKTPQFTFGGPTTPVSTTAPFTFGSSTPAAPSTTPATTPAPAGFSFTTPGGFNNPFQSTTPTTTSKPFTFGDSATPSTTPLSFSFGQPSGDATPKPSHSTSNSFSFGQNSSSAAPPASTPFTFGAATTNVTSTAPSAPSSGGGIVFPTGPTTPLTKTLELDSMDASPIRGGDSSSTGGSSFSAANTGGGFSFGANNTGGGAFGSSAANPFSSTSSGFGAPSTSGFGGPSKDTPSTPSSAPFSFGTPTSTTSSFGQQPPAPSFGQGGGFSFSQPAAANASPFNQPQPLASPAVGGFAQLASPAASPFTQPLSLGSGGSTFGGTPQGQKRLLSEDPSDGGSATGEGGRKIMPMPKPRRARTQAETRNALAKFHRG
ncbi:hypothetical protein CPB86DRAFT_59504 [Serendipita vermifera]|nr:hypothetical protein CPB86DRAFT_59504 [Serendipita vermifera]